MYHHSNYGSFAPSTLDMDGYVPETGDDPFVGVWGHGGQATHDEDGELTEYGEWWVEEGFPEKVERAEAEKAESDEALAECQAGR